MHGIYRGCLDEMNMMLRKKKYWLEINIYVVYGKFVILKTKNRKSWDDVQMNNLFGNMYRNSNDTIYHC